MHEKVRLYGYLVRQRALLIVLLLLLYIIVGVLTYSGGSSASGRRCAPAPLHASGIGHQIITWIFGPMYKATITLINPFQGGSFCGILKAIHLHLHRHLHVHRQFACRTHNSYFQVCSHALAMVIDFPSFMRYISEAVPSTLRSFFNPLVKMSNL